MGFKIANPANHHGQQGSEHIYKINLQDCQGRQLAEIFILPQLWLHYRQRLLRRFPQEHLQ